MLDKPSLIVVGTGIRAVGQMTTETIAWIQISQKVLYLVYDPAAAEVITSLNPGGAESLAAFYVEGKERMQSVREMADRMMECVRAGLRTCVVLFGHPGVFAFPGHDAIRLARREGFSARMLPAISAEDCLFADLGFDPSTSGCQSFESLDVLKNGRQIDPTCLVILWQIGVMGDAAYRVAGYDLSALPLLVERLCRDYPPDHEVIVYEAAIFFGRDAVIQRLPLKDLVRAKLSASSTLCIPPAVPVRPDPEAVRRLKLLLPSD